MFSTTSHIVEVPVTASFVWELFGVTLLVVAAMTGALMYHWKFYGFQDTKMKIFQTIYSIGAVFLLMCALLLSITF